MSNNRFQKPFYIKEDLIDIYTANRLALEKKDVSDLLNCLVKFIQRDNNHYAYEFPYLGIMYSDFKVGDNTDLFYEQKMTESFFGEKSIAKDSLFKRHKKTKEELQEYQNEIFNNSKE